MATTKKPCDRAFLVYKRAQNLPAERKDLMVNMDLALRSAFFAEASILLILLAGAVLLYWSFREKYLLPWIAGWIFYSLSKLFTAINDTPDQPGLWTLLASVFFVTATGLF